MPSRPPQPEDIDSTLPHLPVLARDLDAEAMRRRIGAQLFGESSESVTLGRFRLLETLGAGGMGVVYAAEDDKLKRVVALKVIRDDLLRTHPGERLRLLREARALARVSHPNVVQIHEVVDSDDKIFIVMEYVPGGTLQRWLRSAARSLAEIVAIFVAAGRGLAAAHRAGVVHRDFKPGNVLVSDEGRVCIVDFGLARGLQASTNPGDSDRMSGSITSPLLTYGLTDHSEPGSLAGTPGYMSPEHLVGREVDARSDQFSFCVTLFEALYGQRPFDHEALRGAMLRGAMPPLPTPAGRRVPRSLRRLLKRGLARDPAQRYPSMEALLATLERRRSFVLPLFLAAVVSTAVATGILASRDPVPPAVQACPDPSDQLTGIWDPSIAAAVRHAFVATGQPFAEQVHADVTQVLDRYAREWITTYTEACEATAILKVRSSDLLDRSMICLAHRRDALMRLGGLLRDGGASTVAAAHELVHTLPAVATCSAPETVRRDPRLARKDTALSHARGQLEQARFLMVSSQNQPAIKLAQEVFSTSQDPVTRAEALLILGRIEAHRLNRNDPAVELLHQAYDLTLRAGDDDLVAAIWGELAYVEVIGLQHADAARRSLGHAESALHRVGVGSPVIQADLIDIEGHILNLEGDPGGARARHHRALALREKHIAPGHPKLDESRLLLANNAVDNLEYEEAIGLFTALLAEQRRHLGDNHPQTALTAFNAALAYIDIGKHDTANDLLQRARAATMTTYGADSPLLASIDLALAQVEAARGELRPAIDRLRSALATFSSHFPPNHNERVMTLGLLANYHEQANDPKSAFETHLELLALHEDHGVELDMPVLLSNMGEYLCKVGRCPEAFSYFHDLELRFERDPPADPAQLALPHAGLGLVYLEAGEHILARPLLEQALEILQTNPGAAATPYHIVVVARNLARCLQKLGRAPARVRELRALADGIEAELAH